MRFQAPFLFDTERTIKLSERMMRTEVDPDGVTTNKTVVAHSDSFSKEREQECSKDGTRQLHVSFGGRINMSE